MKLQHMIISDLYTLLLIIFFNISTHLDVDAYSNGLNFVLGEAFGNGRIAAIILPRIKENFYGLKPNKQLFYQRMVIESDIGHELGHVFVLARCYIRLCVIRFSNSLENTDVKGRRFFDSCSRHLPR